LGSKAIELGETTQNRPRRSRSFKLGHRGRYQSKARMLLPIRN